MSGLHEAALVACLVAGAVAVVVAPNRATRGAHAVMLAAMAVTSYAMDSTPLVLLAGAALLVGAAVLRRVTSRAGDLLCALDLAVCGALLVLSAVAVAHSGATGETSSHLRSTGGMGGMAGMSAMQAATPSPPLVVATGAVLLVWLLLQRGAGDGRVRGPRALPGAAMVVTMAAMVVS